MPGDTLYNVVSLLLHGDGADASTTFTDSGPGVLSPASVNGNVQIDTAQSKFGGASMLFDGTGDYLTYADSAVFEFGSGDFTVEAWVRFAGYPADNGGQFNQTIICKDVSGGRGWALAVTGTAASLTTLSFTGFAPAATSVTASYAFALSTWYHVAAVRSGNLLYLFVDGVLLNPGGTAFNMTIQDVATTVRVGGNLFDGTFLYYLNGHLDDLRVTKGAGRYTADFTPPTAALPDTFEENAGDLSATLPMLTLTGTFGGAADVDLPALTLAAYGGGTLEASLPMLTLEAESGGALEVTLPSLTLEATGHNSAGENGLEATLSALTLEASAGAHATLALPTLTLAATGTGTVLGTLAKSLPMPTLSATGTVTEVATGAMTLPMFTAIGYGGAVLEVTVDGITIAATGSTGAVGSLAVTLPLLQLSAEGTQEDHGSAELVMPALVAGPYGSLRATLPGLTLSAVGTATVTATYEGYALNLKHATRDAVDELTHLTNFPFTHIVRFQNSYFGVSATGVFLLEGTTDYAATPTAIPWAWQTGITDFASAKKKTVAALVVGGRLPPAATVTLYAGEDSSQAYSFTTPRGADAQNYRQKFGKGIQDRYYAFGASGSGDLAVDDLNPDVFELSRRI
jgi:hypothetical protein